MKNNKILNFDREQSHIIPQKSVLYNSKICSMDELEKNAWATRKAGKQIVLCHGTFDLLHIGHVKHLQRAKQEGDCLFVTLTSDIFVNKGPGRPVFSQELRAENLAALECVDYVAIEFSKTAINVIDRIKPNVYVKGVDYKIENNDVTGNISLEKRCVEKHGGRVYFTNEITSSSSRLLNEHYQVFPTNTRKYLDSIKSKYCFQEIVDKLNSLANLNVLVIGDAIIDEYHYTNSLGQTGKGNVLAVKYQSEERFAGGAIAVANHVAGFANSVTLTTAIGMQDSHESFINEKLLKNVNVNYCRNPNARTIVKRRYIGDEMKKLFEVYFYDEDINNADLNKSVCYWLDANIQQYDAVVVPDFGNGFISNEMITIIANNSKFLAVNTQMNSGNRGYHVITKYPRVDFASLNEPEIRMAMCNKTSDIKNLADLTAEKVNAKYVAVTRGTEGVLMHNHLIERSHTVPALCSQIVDRIGAGDAFLSLAALSLAKGFESDLSAFIGSAAAALDVQIVCNRESIKKGILLKYIETLLK